MYLIVRLFSEAEIVGSIPQSKVDGQSEDKLLELLQLEGYIEDAHYYTVQNKVNGYLIIKQGTPKFHLMEA
jgi:hypothetical protein